MIYNCLTVSLYPLILFALIVNERYDLFAAFIVTVMLLFRFVGWLHHRIVREEGRLHGMTNMSIGCEPGFVDPDELPWYRGWSLYAVEADDPEGLRRQYSAFLTWTWFGLRGHTVSFSTCEDYECYNASGERIFPSSLVEDKNPVRDIGKR